MHLLVDRSGSSSHHAICLGERVDTLFFNAPMIGRAIRWGRVLATFPPFSSLLARHYNLTHNYQFHYQHKQLIYTLRLCVWVDILSRHNAKNASHHLPIEGD